MPEKTWTFTLTPPDGPASTREGLSHDEAVRLITDLMYGRFESATAGAPARQPASELAAAA